MSSESSSFRCMLEEVLIWNNTCIEELQNDSLMDGVPILHHAIHRMKEIIARTTTTTTTTTPGTSHHSSSSSCNENHTYNSERTNCIDLVDEAESNPSMIQLEIQLRQEPLSIIIPPQEPIVADQNHRTTTTTPTTTTTTTGSTSSPFGNNNSNSISTILLQANESLVMCTRPLLLYMTWYCTDAATTTTTSTTATGNEFHTTTRTTTATTSTTTTTNDNHEQQQQRQQQMCRAVHQISNVICSVLFFNIAIIFHHYGRLLPHFVSTITTTANNDRNVRYERLSRAFELYSLLIQLPVNTDNRNNNPVTGVSSTGIITSTISYHTGRMFVHALALNNMGHILSLTHDNTSNNSNIYDQTMTLLERCVCGMNLRGVIAGDNASSSNATTATTTTTTTDDDDAIVNPLPLFHDDDVVTIMIDWSDGQLNRMVLDEICRNVIFWKFFQQQSSLSSSVASAA